MGVHEGGVGGPGGVSERKGLKEEGRGVPADTDPPETDIGGTGTESGVRGSDWGHTGRVGGVGLPVSPHNAPQCRPVHGPHRLKADTKSVEQIRRPPRDRPTTVAGPYTDPKEGPTESEDLMGEGGRL